MEIRKLRYNELGEELCAAVLPNGLRVRVIPKKGFSSYFACFGTYYGSVMRSFLLSGERRRRRQRPAEHVRRGRGSQRLHLL